MWNLSSIAAKAQEAAAKAAEAAARIERQLDDSVGIEGATAAPTAPESAISAAHDDLNDDDDFFSDNHHSDANALSSAWDGGVAKEKEADQPPAATKLDVSADEGDDFFGDGDSPPAPAQGVKAQAGNAIEEEDEEVDFGGDDAGGDGWDDADDIPLDDDDLEVDAGPGPMPVPESKPEPVQPEQLRADNVHHEEPSVPPLKIDTVSAVGEYPAKEEGDIHVHEPSLGAPADAGQERDSVHDTEEILHDDEPKQTVEPGHTVEPEQNEEQTPSADQIGSFEEDHAEMGLSTNESGEVTDNVHEGENLPASVAHENGSKDEQHPAIIPEEQPPMPAVAAMEDAEKQQFLATIAGHDEEKQQFLATIAELESQLYQREQQLSSRADQITSLSLQHESEQAKLRQTITETKEEAKKRIMRAKERVEEMQTKLTDAVRRADAAGGSNQEQSDVIAALRAEGEQLARKQSQMEQAVRNAKGEARELYEKLEIEKDARVKVEDKASSLEKEVKTLKEDLSSARKGESQSKKLEGELVDAKEESEKQRASKLVLEQQLKELKEENKSLKKEVADAKEGAAVELEGESNKLRKERDDMLGDLESKLRTSEREANVREDALRHEVSELRKRWQDAVRRAEGLSMDVQHSTAPLLRQLESTERQSRARASAWAELETKLRSDLEDHVIQLEKLTKERNDLIASDKRCHRLLKEKEAEIASSEETIDSLSSTIDNLETKVEELEEEGKRVQQDLVVAERKATQGASKIKNEMMQSVVESEERYQSQIDATEEELEGERQKRRNLEKQLDELAESVAAAEFAHASAAGNQSSPAREKKLRSADNQASILHDTLAGFDSDVDDDEDESNVNGLDPAQGQGSFAAMEQLSLGLKGAKVELEALKKQLTSSEETRESLLDELGTARQAVEKLPLFEQKVSELTTEVNLKDMEIQALQDDIADVRSLYRSQLDALLEEKATTPSSSSHVEADIVLDDDDW